MDIEDWKVMGLALEEAVNSDSKTFVVCTTAWDWEVGHDAMGTTIYPSVKALKTYHDCWPDCGIVEVEMRFLREIEPASKMNPPVEDDPDADKYWTPFKKAIEASTQEVGLKRSQVLAMRISQFLVERRKSGALSESDIESIASMIERYDELRTK